jgi:hypothetical protein
MVLLNKKGKLGVFFVSLVLYVLFSFVINNTWNVIELNRRHGGPFNTQAAVYNYINNIQRVPETTADLCALSDSPVFQKDAPKYIQYYDPNAWQDPRRIFLHYQRGRFHWITFGDGTQAIATYLIKHSYLREPGEPKPQMLDASVHKFEHFPRVVVLGAIAILITTFVNNKLLRRRKVNTS